MNKIKKVVVKQRSKIITIKDWPARRSLGVGGKE